MPQQNHAFNKPQTNSWSDHGPAAYGPISLGRMRWFLIPSPTKSRSLPPSGPSQYYQNNPRNTYNQSNQGSYPAAVPRLPQPYAPSSFQRVHEEPYSSQQYSPYEQPHRYNFNHQQHLNESPHGIANIGYDSEHRNQRSNHYGSELKMQMIQDRERKDRERGFDRSGGGGAAYFGGGDRNGGGGGGGYGQIQHGGLVGQQHQQHQQETPYFGNNTNQQQQPYHPQEAMHFGRRMAQQINVTHDVKSGFYLFIFIFTKGTNFQQEITIPARAKRASSPKKRAGGNGEISEEGRGSKKEREMEQFNPWGKAGGGAPLRNSDGSISTNLRNSRNDNGQTGQQNPMLAMQQQQQQTQQQPMMGVGSGYQANQTYNNNMMPPQLGMNNFLSSLAQSSFNQPYGMENPSLGLGMSMQPGFGGINHQSGMGMQQANGAGTAAAHPNAPKTTFLRGQVNIDQIPDWQRAEMEQKHRAQMEIQEALKKQVQEREAVKAKIEAEKREEEAKEQDRIVKEQEMLRLKYAKELEEQRRKEAETQAENDKKLAEKIAKAKEQEAQREKTYREAEEKKKNQPSSVKNSNDKLDSSQNDLNPAESVPFRSNSPPIPTLRSKQPKQPGAGGGNPTTLNEAMTQQLSEALNQRMAHPPAPPALAVSKRQSNELEANEPKNLPPKRTQLEPKVDTSAVLEQLLNIQRELEDEDQKIKDSLSTPVSLSSTREKS
ncbi:hypothetical protein BDR26DRAFT_894667 [Obelidium mucronatum]|nr:hypothetical protein BDR26DRAFT_894667 [Obelidium mucronatum]